MTNFILTVLLAFGFLVVFYRFAVRRLLRLAFIERIEVLEKQLKKMVETGNLSQSDFTYLFIAKKFQVKNHLGQIGISGFLHFLICRDRNTPSDEDTKRFNLEASPELRQLHHVFCRDLVRWMVVNSPSYSVLGTIVIGGVMLYKSIDEKKVKEEAFTFADMEAQTCGC